MAALFTFRLLSQPIIILVIGICISLTKNPIVPIMKNPTAMAMQVRLNSWRFGLVQRFINRMESLKKPEEGIIKDIWSFSWRPKPARLLHFRSGNILHNLLSIFIPFLIFW